MGMTTITVSEKTREELLKVAAELQSKRGKRVDYEEAIEYLIQISRRKPELLRRAMIGTGATSKELQAVLRAGREEDKRHEEGLERRYLS